jgi:uncharacterized protein YndB with AHSA1/START domain
MGEWMDGARPEDGQIRQIGDDLFELRFVRRIPRPVEKVWAALTIPERLADWLGPFADIDLRLGGHFIVWFARDNDDAVRAMITGYEPNRLLVLDWGGSEVRWELTAEPGGCRLTFSQRSGPSNQPNINAFWLLGGAAGWHGFLDDLALAAQDAPGDSGFDYGAVWGRYETHFGPRIPGFDQPPALRHAEPYGLVTPAGDGLYDVRLERRFNLPIETVWAALTEPARLADWFAQAKIEPWLGGAVEFRWDLHGHVERGFIVAFEPPKRLAWAIPGPEGRHSVVRFDLVREDEKVKRCTLLTLTQTLVPTEHLLSVGTGWHAHLHELPEAAARSTPRPWTLEHERERSRREMADLVPAYRRRLPRGAAEVAWTH